MSIERYGTFLLLLRIYNESEEYSTEKTLSKYLLEHFSDIKDLNIYDVAMDCHMSRATVRRFFSRLDYESFLEFKNEFTIPYDFSMFEKELDRKNYVDEHLWDLTEVQNFFKENKLNILDKIKALSFSLFSAKNIYWLTSTSTTRMVEDMQMQFLQLGSFWNILINFKADKNPIIYKDDIVIVLSSSAVMAHNLSEELKKLTCPVYLVTLNREYEHSVFEDIIRLTDHTLYNFTEQISIETIKKEVVNRKYATNLFFDFLYFEYHAIEK